MQNDDTHSNNAQLLLPTEVAEILRVSPESVRRWMREGFLPSIKVGRRPLIRRDTVDAIIRDGLLVDSDADAA